MSLSKLGISTLADARRFDSMYPSDMVLAGCRAGTCTIKTGFLKNIINSILGVDREIQVAPILARHICHRCEFAMRNNDNMHYLFRFVPMSYKDEGIYTLGSLDPSREELTTFCTQGLNQSVFSKIPDDDNNCIPVIHVPLSSCTSFAERKK